MPSHPPDVKEIEKKARTTMYGRNSKERQPTIHFEKKNYFFIFSRHHGQVQIQSQA
jgi:hypothetical protein